MPKRYYGWRPGLPNKRFPQLTLASYPPLAAAASVITTGFLPPIWDQGQTGSCTGHGSTRAIAFARAKQSLPFVDLSRLFAYWNARVAEGTQWSDSGASVSDVIAAAQQFGAPPYTDLPTDPSLVTVQPSAQTFADALANKAILATRVLGANPASFQYHFKHCIGVLGLPVVFGFTVYESFESDAVASSGIMPVPGPSEQIVGGHCVVATAYDDAAKMVTCDNSWSDTWGQAGRFQMPYECIFDIDMASDFHAIETEAG